MAERTCRICDAVIVDTTYHPEGRGQRCCSMACLRIHWRDKERAKVLAAGTAKPTGYYPCRGCASPISSPPGKGAARRYCTTCRPTEWAPREMTCPRCHAAYMKTERNRQRLCPTCIATPKEAGMTGKHRKRTPIQAKDRPLNYMARKRVAADVRYEEPSCHLCGYLVDVTLNRQTHPLGSTIDEVVPRVHGGSALDRSNLRHCHRVCNTSRGARPVTPQVRERARVLVERLMGVVAVAETRRW